MPCGVTICQDCFSKMRSNQTNCKFCGKQHETDGTLNNSIELILNLYKASKDNASEQHYDNLTNLQITDLNKEKVSLPASLKASDLENNIHDNVKSM